MTSVSSGKVQKTWYMVRKDLERVGIPYETPDGIADFHAAGRHSHITGLVRSGASIMEAKELARHADIRQTAKYTHIGMEDRAEALGNLPSIDVYANVDRLHIVCISGGVLGQEVSPVVSEPDQDAQPGNEQTPDCSGVVSSSDASCHQIATYSEVEAAGIAPEVAVPQVVSPHTTCGDQGCQWLHYGCTDATLSELVAAWPQLPPYVVRAIMALVRTSQPVP